MGRHAKNEIGHKYGKLTVVDMGTKTADGHIKWLCKCDCGNMIEVSGQLLRRGSIKSCGCNSTTIVNEIGHKYGKLVVIDKAPSMDGHAHWYCQCECGSIINARGTNLRLNKITSCGCVHSRGEQYISQWLSQHQYRFVTQYSFNDLKYKNYLRFDFALLDSFNTVICLIEYNGAQHYKDVGEFGKLQREVTDNLKQLYCQENNIPLFIIKYNDNIEEQLVKYTSQITKN